MRLKQRIAPRTGIVGLFEHQITSKEAEMGSGALAKGQDPSAVK